MIEASYRVERHPRGIVVFGTIPVVDFSALTIAWGEEGIDTMVPGIASALRANIAVCRKENEEEWRAEVEQSLATGDAEMDWVNSTDTGLSALTMFIVLAASDTASAIAKSKLGSFGPTEPSDPADFGRCYRLIKKFNWFDRIHEVSMRYQKGWVALVFHWMELSLLWEEESPSGSCPKLYERMRELLEAKEPTLAPQS